MANNSIQTPSSRPRSCERCGKRLSQSPRSGRLACDTCRASPPNVSQQRPGSQPSSTATSTSIPSTYLDLLDSKIAEYEHAAERSDSNDQSTNAGESTKIAQSNYYSPYIQDGLRKPSKSNRSQPKSTSVAMTRFLNDPTEPDGVRDAIASRLLKSR